MYFDLCNNYFIGSSSSLKFHLDWSFSETFSSSVSSRFPLIKVAGIIIHEVLFLENIYIPAIG